MLHSETLKRETFQLLKELMQDERLNQFNLAGGTALALYLGHRISVDLDMFTPYAFDVKELEDHLIQRYNFMSDYKQKNTLKGTIGGVKVDCITHAYPFSEGVMTEDEGFRLYSIQDIAAMKLGAVADNGTRLKDFIDIACLSTRLSLAEMLEAYKKKYSNVNPVGPVMGLKYYDDINFKEPIQMMGGRYKWDLIEKRLADMSNDIGKVFRAYPIEPDNKIREISDISIVKPPVGGLKIRCRIDGVLQMSVTLNEYDSRRVENLIGKSSEDEEVLELKRELAEKYFRSRLEDENCMKLKK